MGEVGTWLPSNERGICFDLDGTLIDSGREGYKRMLDIAHSRNLPINDAIEEQIRKLWGMEPIKFVQTLWPEEDPKAFLAAWEEWDISHPHPAFPGTQEALGLLIQSFCLTILTNRYLRTVAPQLANNNILHYFDLVATPESNGCKKPDPKSMETIFRHYAKLGIPREKVIVVGDTVHGDWKLASALGLKFYAVTCGGVDSREKFLEAGVSEDCVFESVAHLAPTLLRK